MALTVNNRVDPRIISVAKRTTAANKKIFPTIQLKQPAPIPQPNPNIALPKPKPYQAITPPKKPAQVQQPAVVAKPAAGVKIATPKPVAPAVNPADLIRQSQVAADLARIKLFEQKRLAAEAKNAEVTQRKGFWTNRITGGVASFFDQRANREKAQKQLEFDNNEMFAYVEAKKRMFEREAARLNNELINNRANPDFEKMLKNAIDWQEKEIGTVEELTRRYNKRQKDLHKKSIAPITGGVSKVIGAAAKVVSVPLAGLEKGWNYLSWTASQGERLANTLKNLNTPAGSKLYYGGEESNVPVKGIKDAYNKSKDQRLFGTPKAVEEARNKPRTIRTVDQNGKPITINIKPTAFDRFWNRYADDAGNLIADPINLVGGGVAKFIGKGANKLVDNKVINKLSGNKFAQWLGAESKPRGARASDKVNEIIETMRDEAAQFRSRKQNIYAMTDTAKRNVNAKLSEFMTKQGNKAKGLVAKRDDLTRKSLAAETDYVKAFSKFSEKEINVATKWAAMGGKGTMDGIDPKRAKQLQRLIDDYQVKAALMADADRLAKNQRRSKYLPRVLGADYNFRKSRKFYRKGEGGMTKQGLLESLVIREFKSDWDETHRFIDEAKTTERELRASMRGTKIAKSRADIAKLRLVTKRRKALEALAKQQRSRFDELQSEIDKTRKGARGILKNPTLRGARNTAADIANAPLNIWRKSVLKYRPAWYVNNASWNIPAAISAGGLGAVPEMAKLTFSKKYRAKVDKLSEPAQSKISREFGKDKGARLASMVENIPRRAAYLANKKRGYNDADNLKRVNDWLFDYSNKRWEQPIRQVFPFYNWSKGLAKITAKMPFKYGKQANLYTGAYDQFYKRPLEQLSDEAREFEDPITGEKIKISERQKYKGRLKIGNKWFKTPFNAITPEQLGQLNANPYLMVADQLAKSKDRFGFKTTDRSPAEILGEAFPQFKVWRDNNNRTKSKFERYFSDSGYGKEAQGEYPSDPSYKENLDMRKRASKTLRSFFGVPNSITRDPKEAEYRKRYDKFNKEYFDTDWDKRLEDLKTLWESDKSKNPNPWDTVNAERQALAKKFGFDFEKDIVKGEWSKYDTATTSNTKRLKEEARKFQQDFWDEYTNVPKPRFIKTASGGYYEPSTIRPHLIKKFKQWDESDTYAKNPYYKLPYYNKKSSYGDSYTVEAGKEKKQYIDPYKLGVIQSEKEAKAKFGKYKYSLWQKYWKLDSYEEKSAFLKKHPFLLSGKKRKQSPYQFDGKFFKSAASMARYKAGKGKKAFWDRYWATDDPAIRKQMIAANPQYSKFTPGDSVKPKSEKQIAAEFWDKYFATDDIEDRRRLLDTNPKYQKYGDPEKIGFAEFRTKRKAEQVKTAMQSDKFADFAKSFMLYFERKKPFIPQQRRFKKVVYKR